MVYGTDETEITGAYYSDTNWGRIIIDWGTQANAADSVANVEVSICLAC